MRDGEKKLYVVTCVDDTSCGMVEGDPRGGSRKRMENYSAHRAYQDEAGREGSPNYMRKLCAGPMVSEDGRTMIGSHFLLEGTRSEVDAFLAGDPFSVHGVWGQRIVNRYISPSGIVGHKGGNL